MAKIELKHIFIFNSVVGFLFGLGFMIIPATIMASLGMSIEADGPISMRFFGTLIFGSAILLICIRNEPNSTARQGVLLMGIFNYIVMDLFHFIFFDLSNLMLWSVIILHTTMAFVYGYFFIKNRGK